MNDNDAMLAIQALMDLQEWSADTLEEIAAILATAGYPLQEPDDGDKPDGPNIGARCACSRCGQDLEYNGTSWTDRGGGSTCGPYADRGNVILEDHTKPHQPNYRA